MLMGMNSLAAYLQLQVVWVYDLPLQVVWVKMRFKMALRYLTDTQQKTTCCLNYFQKFFDNPT
ncbi:hypothetical protein FXE69_12030 [Vibrio cholerae]|uniref:Uncharacterized protein n=1 Tax=Vibrio cholerae TaxID=666 RepID=A0A5C9SYX2_VIBCL|nr:hypothetical protein [Vibrio cholerae]NAO56766.1 hypothetical protein [Vibrio cholerae]OSP46200.1 hypothetical protein B7937_14165 [Vibrio cholerae]TQP80268.1 hypothetical protein FLL88_12895 [Vibrio cholerae]TVM53989.1 hypothetical protein FPV38_10430 [Vibrio cholerae]